MNAQTIQAATREAVESRVAYRIVARLNESATGLGPDIAERLRFSRELALDKARSLRAAESVSVVGMSAGAGVLGAGNPWWLRAASIAPLVALIGGLVLIQEWQSKAQISVAAEVDTQLLSDDLPLNAYRDAGFVEFLKTSPRE